MNERKERRGAGGGALRDPKHARLLTILCLAVGSSLSTAVAKYAGGDGSASSPYLIATVADLQLLAKYPGDWGKCFQLTRDLDLSDCNEATVPIISYWDMPGSSSNRSFQGDFNGDGKAIANFQHRDTASEYVGLFPYVSGTIRNLKLVHPTVVGNKSGTGALVGYLDAGSVLNCSAAGVDVQGNVRVGGLAGHVKGAVNSSCSDGLVSGVQYVGGLLGQVSSGSISKCYSKARVTGGDSAGGLVGITASLESILNSCYATGDVKGTNYVAGLAGQIAPGIVSHCYSVGKVTGTQYVGGLIGYQRGLAAVYGSLWDTQTSTQATSVGGVGKTTAQMKSADTFLAQNWDFPAIWSICDGMGYPIFSWQIPLGDLDCPDGVDFRDFAKFARYWRNTCRPLDEGCQYADLDQSGVVDVRDLALFAENWLAGI